MNSATDLPVTGAARTPSGRVRRPMHPYLELSKARLTALVLLTTLVGFVIGAPGPVDAALLFWTLLGTGLCAAGANGLNQWIEFRRDGAMERTRHRPLPSGSLTRRHAFVLSLSSSIAGTVVLAARVNLLTSALGAFVVVLYVLAYTPLKHRTPFCTLVGAVCGAIPPMMGWTGATGALAYGAWILAAVLFFWQVPHFLALAWLYRVDYARGGFRMLPSIDPSGRLTGMFSVVYSIALLPLGMLALLGGLAGWAFLVGSIVLGAGFTLLGLRLHRRLSDTTARHLFLGSLAYLPLLLGLMVFDRGPVAVAGGDYRSARLAAQLSTAMAKERAAARASETPPAVLAVEEPAGIESKERPAP